MKFWKLPLLVTLVFFALTSTIIYSSCEKNPCNNVTCYNGGSCSSGKCRCPTGYENTQCQSKTTDRFVGVYAGTVQCDNLSAIIDSCFITPGTKINTVVVRLKSISPKILVGYINNNESAYSIVVTNNDSTATFARIHTITIQNDKTLSIHAYNLNYSNPSDSSTSTCTFLGIKKS